MPVIATAPGSDIVTVSLKVAVTNIFPALELSGVKSMLAKVGAVLSITTVGEVVDVETRARPSESVREVVVRVIFKSPETASEFETDTTHVLPEPVTDFVQEPDVPELPPRLTFAALKPVTTSENVTVNSKAVVLDGETPGEVNWTFNIRLIGT